MGGLMMEGVVGGLQHQAGPLHGAGESGGASVRPCMKYIGEYDKKCDPHEAYTVDGRDTQPQQKQREGSHRRSPVGLHKTVTGDAQLIRMMLPKAADDVGSNQKRLFVAPSVKSPVGNSRKQVCGYQHRQADGDVQKAHFLQTGKVGVSECHRREDGQHF